MLSLFIIVNIVIAVLHPLKYIPQCIHIVRRESVDDLSLSYIGSEVLLNLSSTSITLNMLIVTHNFVYFVPIFCEKLFTLLIILYILYLKYKYASNNNNTLHDVSSNEELLNDEIDNTWDDGSSNDN